VEGTVFDWMFTAMTSLVLQGNAWGYITGRDGYGFPTGIEWIPPDDVECTDDEMQPWNPLRTRIYVYGRRMDRSELFHIKAFSLAGRTEGISLLRAFAMTILAGIETQRYGTDWYRAGGFPPGTFQNTEIEISAEQAEEIRALLTATIQRRQPLVHGRDWTYTPISVPPNEAQFIQAMQLNATQIAAILGLPPDRLGGTKGDSLTYCSDMNTQLLSRHGWLNADEVRVGDTCLTLNTSTGMAEWQPVKAVNIFPGPHDVIKMRNQTHSSVTTPDHRWPVMLDAGTGRTEASGWQWRTTETLPSDARISAAAPVYAPPEPKWSDALVELIAWFWTEGWVGDSGQVTLTQSGAVNPGNVARIRAALTEMFGPDVKITGRSLLGSKGREKRVMIRAELDRDPDRSNREIARACNADGHTVARVRAGKIDALGWTEDIDGRGISHFRLNADAGHVLSEHAPDKVVSTEFLSELTHAQLELFYQVSVDADGTRRPDGVGAVMVQKDVRRVESFQVACALTGRSGVVRGPDSHGMYHISIQVTPWRKPAGHARYLTRKTTAEAVWCPTTDNGTWFARRDGTTYFTGNSTVEQSTLQVIEAMRPWLVRLETAFFELIPSNRYVRFNSDALLKTDLATRSTIYAAQRGMGLRTTDELRDLEDLEPLPGGVGAEPIALDVITAMAQRILAIPKSMLPTVALEMDLAADRLQKLADAGLASPVSPPGTMPPPAPGAEQFLGGLIGKASFPSGSQESRDLDLVMNFLAHRRSAARKETEPEFVGAWIPSPRELILNGSNGHNGNGRNGSGGQSS
jgi:phage portal protein BeeE